MDRKVVLIMALMLLIGVLEMAFNLERAEASGTIYIRADGSIDPPTAPIQRDGNHYNITGSITSDGPDGIVVERSNIVIDGNGYILQGSGNGFRLDDVNGVTVKNIVLKDFECGVCLNSTSLTFLSENWVFNTTYGIWMCNSTSNVINSNVFIANDHNIQISESSNNTINKNHIASIDLGKGILLIYGGIELECSSNNTIIQNNVTQCQQAITIEGRMYSGEDASNNTIIENTVDHIPWSNGLGIGLERSSNNIISRNEVTPSKGFTPHYGQGIAAIQLSNSFNNSIINNSIRGNDEGIKLMGSSLINITDNNLTNNMYGIHLEGSQYNLLVGNNVTYVLVPSGENNATERIGYCGILIRHPYYSNLLRNNSIAGYIFNFGIERGYCFQDIDTSNTVDEKPIYYWVNKQGGQIPSDAGYVAIVNSTDITLEGLDLKNNYQGILIAYSNDTIIRNNNVTDNRYGIHFDSSAVCSNNTIYHNNFINNPYNQVEFWGYGYPSVNVWDNGYPSGGNFWSDYNGTDANYDGIGDTSYVIDANNTDHYPLMQPWTAGPLKSDLNHDGTVSILDIFIVANAFGGKPGDPNWNATGDINKDEIVNILDIFIVAWDFGKAV